MQYFAWFFPTVFDFRGDGPLRFRSMRLFDGMDFNFS
jgi:hypothetical protein